MRRLLPVLLLFMAAVPARAQIIDGRQDRRRYETAVRETYLKRDWAALELTVEELRARKDRFPEGVWTIDTFYSGMALPRLPMRVARVLDEYIRGWEEARPLSVAARIVHARFLMDALWDSRAGGAPAVDRAGAQRVQDERLAQARKVLEDAESLGPPPIDWFVAMLELGLQQGWPAAEFDAIFERAIKQEPGYYTLYFRKADFVRRYGEREGWERFAEHAARELLPGEGLTLYARIAWSESYLYPDLFKATRIEWPKMKQGFEDMERQYPGSPWNLNNFCRFACLAGDRETAKALFDRIGEEWTTNWLSHGAFAMWRRWADPSRPGAVVPVRAEFDAPGGAGWGMTHAADGKSVFAVFGGTYEGGGYVGGKVVEWDTTTKQSVWSSDREAGSLICVAVSPDGKWLAAGSGNHRDPQFVGAISVYDLATHQRRILEGAKGGIFAIRFSPDGTKLAAVGGAFGRFGELRTWEVGSWKELAHVSDWPMNLIALTFTPDSSRIIGGCGQSFYVWNATTLQLLFDPPGRLNENSVGALVFSRDGAVLACGTSGMYDNRDRPAEVTFWDAEKWTRRADPRITAAGGVLALDYSRDGRWLLGGGYDGILRVWDAATGKRVAEYPVEGENQQIGAVSFAPDGKSVACVRYTGKVTIYDFTAPPAP